MILRSVIAWWCAAGATMWSADGTQIATPVHAWQSYRVEFVGSGYPSWFYQLAISGLRRAGPGEAADIVVQVEALPSAVTWTAWRESDSAISPISLERRVPLLTGVGEQRCYIVAIDRLSGAVVATIDLSIQDPTVCWTPPQPDYRMPSGLPVVLPGGRAWAWSQQAWAEAFQRAEQQLSLRVGSGPKP